MTIRKDAIKLAHGPEVPEDGLQSRFNAVGQLTYLALYERGECAVELEVEPELCTARFSQLEHFRIQAELPSPPKQQLHDWTRSKMMDMQDKAEGVLHCDFCLRDSEEVDRLIQGPNLYICNTCVELCVAILSQSAND